MLSACPISEGATRGPEPEEQIFDKHEIVIGPGPHGATVLTGFFLAGAVAELVVVETEEDRAPRMRLYGFDGTTWELLHTAELSRDIRFVDVARAGDRDLLLVYTDGGFAWFDFEALRLRPLLEVSGAYQPTLDQEGSPLLPGAELPQVDVTRDLNGDGRDDLVMPALEGFWISTQTSDGAFSEAVQLGPAEPFRDASVGTLGHGRSHGDHSARKPRTYGDVGITATTVPLYLDRIHSIDYDHDGRSDLAFWNQDHFDVHLQNEQGSFELEPESFRVEMPIDSEGAYSHAFEYVERSVASMIFRVGKKSRSTVLHSLQDLDGDSVADLVTLTLSGRSLTKQQSIYKVYFGIATFEGTVFGRDTGAEIRPRGRAGGMEPFGYSSRWFEDFDRDGKVDVLLRDVNVGIGGMVRALVGNSVPLNLELYRMSNRHYPQTATLQRKIQRFAPFAGIGSVFFPPVLVGDVTGDSRPDLLVGQNPKTLLVYPGISGPEVFAADPVRLAVEMPSDERRTRLVDLDRDGTKDLLVVHGPTTRDPEAPHRIVLLMFR